MPNTKARLLIVDDESSIRLSMTQVLIEIGYRVCAAEDGFSALRELRLQIPDILLTDLNMPGMSGFELLTVVRQRFPSLRTVAMSGMFCGNEVPSGVAADAFYQKGSSVGSLLKIFEGLPQPDRMTSQHVAPSEFLCVQPGGNGGAKEDRGSMTCPECLRSLPLPAIDEGGPVHETSCIHCRARIRYVVAESTDEVPAEARQRYPRKAEANGVPQFDS
jgi:CheY-like chemotaxis protein